MGALINLTQSQLDAINTALVARFNNGLTQGKPDWKKLAMQIPSDSDSNTYAWLSQFPAFREWVGARLHKLFSETAYQVKNRKFENTVDIPVEKLEDDKWGMYAGLAEMHGISVTDLHNELVFSKVAAGFSEVCYDGQFYFDTDHPVYPNEDGTGVPTTVSNMQAGVGEPWILLCTDRAPKPLYLQERSPAQFWIKPNALTSDYVFDNDAVPVGGRWRGEAVFGFWQLAFGSKAAATVENFEAAFKAMETVNRDGEKPIGATPNLLVCGPNNRSAFEQILKTQKNAAGADNINYNKVELFVTPWVRA
ncbi:Mu-like prophage major head subunit gpT family protein [Candidatus Ferrigenium straubiae]|jgi:phage major head subunit gpT-like protein|uniref:Mu-like prophage major head subunit gpT family protein n=1 Tax=Candidatus Ferrigenium straubiae TaxID=2919506 RepID=UPI003F4AB8EC